MDESFGQILRMMVVFFFVSFFVFMSIPVGFADGDEHGEERIYTDVPDLIVTHAAIGDFDADGACDGMHVFYKNIGGDTIPLDEDGFMASLVINDLYSSGYAAIYNNQVNVPDELKEIRPGQEFYELIPYRSLLQFGFKSGIDNKIRVVVDTRDTIHELYEDNNEGIFTVDDDACRSRNDSNRRVWNRDGKTDSKNESAGENRKIPMKAADMYKTAYRDSNSTYEMEYKGDKIEYTIKRQSDACDGCKNEGICLGIGFRLIQNEIHSFCGVSGLQPQKERSASCQKDYECQSNSCESSACVDVQVQRMAQMNLLERMFAWFGRIFW